MRFHWGWIEPVMPVPYVPTLGPVRPGDPLPDLFEAVVEIAGTGRFLPYDKDRRWSATKTERVLVDGIEHDQRQTLVPTLLERGAGTVKVHVYGAEPDSLTAGADLARKLAAAHGAAKARVVWFLGPEQPEAYAQGVGTRVQFKDFTHGPGEASAVPVHYDKQLHEEAGFGEFAEEMAADGFAFLHQQMQAGTVGPVLTVLHDGRVAGAIGPMETMADPTGSARLLPQYFGVLPQYRGHGYGRALWRAAMHWGHQHSAAYQLLQTEVGGASDRLCQAEGLASLGFVNQRSA
ncbi:GNAT family N-acetyltransferase [Streptomyces sp. NRRL B-3648]|uniref:GNAT family N-acetyltransferase n=1 Tax=Streptomyces sp. NRRL B-3648 TaxID=1519493 RepID=UPI0006AF48F9|nr:GNAT family N-acetyltransferase [Streptomyces sp. NRRL B-3648]KOV98852.1 acetyltransferase [Streptomyces sp. NRRL B-3648]